MWFESMSWMPGHKCEGPGRRGKSGLFGNLPCMYICLALGGFLKARTADVTPWPWKEAHMRNEIIIDQSPTFHVWQKKLWKPTSHVIEFLTLVRLVLPQTGRSSTGQPWCLNLSYYPSQKGCTAGLDFGPSRLDFVHELHYLCAKKSVTHFYADDMIVYCPTGLNSKHNCN